jgi:ABC-2 type transport system ATP-binding protein
MLATGERKGVVRTMQVEPAVTFVEVNKTVGDLFGKKNILTDISLDVPHQCVCGLVGHNGAGKSTIISLAVGLQEPTSGQVLLSGRAPGAAEARRHLGYAHEQPALPATLSAREILEYHLALLERGPETVGQLLETVQLKDTPRRVSAFSKGMRQRLTLAIALAGDPQLLVLDEPMSGLDPVGRALVRDIILQQKKLGKTILFSSHVLSDVASLCDKVIVVREGKIVLDEPVAQTRTSAWCIQLREGETTEWTKSIAGIIDIDRATIFVSNDAVWQACQAAQSAGCVIHSVAPREIDLERRILPLLMTHHE